MMSIFRRRSAIAVLILVAAVIGGGLFAWQRHRQTGQPAGERVRFRLQWTPQAQFAGYLVAKDLGYYAEAGLDVEVRPAGPDLKPQQTVASGTDDVAVGVANQVIAARSAGVPLKIIAQIFQDSANRYILKRENAIRHLTDLRGKKVGLYLGGDEAEFVAMLKSANMTLSDVIVIPLGFSIAPFLENSCVVCMVTVYNELIQVYDNGYDKDKLQILTPSDYSAAIVGDMIFTTEKYLMQHRDTVRKFLEASLRGWRYAAENPEKTVDVVLKFDQSLKREDQIKQLREVIRLVLAGPAKASGIGYMNRGYYVTAEQVLVDSLQISKRVDPGIVFDDSVWRDVPSAAKVAQVQ